MNAIRYNLPAPTSYTAFTRFQGQSVVAPASSLASGYLDTSLGKPAQGGFGTPRPLTGWLWPRT